MQSQQRADEALKNRVYQLLTTAEAPVSAQEILTVLADPSLNIHLINSALYQLNKSIDVWKYQGSPVKWSTMDLKHKLEGTQPRQLKSTPEQQEAVFNLLKEAQRPVTAHEIFEYLKSELMPDITLTNVNSALGFLSSRSHIPYGKNSDAGKTYVSWETFNRMKEEQQQQQSTLRASPTTTTTTTTVAASSPAGASASVLPPSSRFSSGTGPTFGTNNILSSQVPPPSFQTSPSQAPFSPQTSPLGTTPTSQAPSFQTSPLGGTTPTSLTSQRERLMSLIYDMLSNFSDSDLEKVYYMLQ